MWKRRPHNFTPTQRRAILARQPHCAHCHAAPSAHADHIIPVAEGGTSTLDNGQGLCIDCHSRKTWFEQRRGIQRMTERLHTDPTLSTRTKQARDPDPHPGIIHDNKQKH